MVVATPVPVVRREALRVPLSDNTWRDWVAGQIEDGYDRFEKARSGAPALAELTYEDWYWFSAAQAPAPGACPAASPSATRMAPRPSTRSRSLNRAPSGLARATSTNCPTKPDPALPPCGLIRTRKALTVVGQALAWVGQVAEQAGLRGTYGVGVRTSGIGGAVAEPRRQTTSGWIPPSHYQDQPPYCDNDYRDTALVTSAEIDESLPIAIDRLLGFLLRSLNYGDPLRPEGASF